MKQLNLNVTAEFERDLRSYMQRKSIPNKSDAIRQALREAVEWFTVRGYAIIQERPVASSA